MESLFNDSTLRLIKSLPLLIWSIFLGLFEWIIPMTWYCKDVDEDVVLITGGGSGLGRAIALEYAKLGSTLILWDINETGLDDTKALVEFEYSKRDFCSKGKFCLTYLVDVSDKEKVKEASHLVYYDLNKNKTSNQPERYVTVLINNAGIYHGLMLQDLTDNQIERIFKINILAHFWTVRAFLPKMIENKRGHIVEIASMAGIAGLFKQVDYCATKFATVGFEESLSIELDHMGLGDKIHTTAVCPLFFSSNLFTGFDAKVAQLMSSEFVAYETVMAMRCNHSRVLLPKFSAYLNFIMKTYMPRRSIILFTKTLGLAQGIKEIKGKAAEIGC